MARKKQKKTPELAEHVLADTKVSQGGFRSRLERYSSLKERQQAVSDYILHCEPGLSKIRRSLDSCGSWLLFRRRLRTDESRLVGGVSCKIFHLCPLCASRRGSRQAMEYGLKIQQLIAETGCIPVLITRTVKNGPDLKERYEHLNKAHSRMVQRRRQSLSSKAGTRGKAARSVLRHVLGSVGSYEFKIGKNSSLWHPHIHEIALLDPAAGIEFTEVVIKGKKVEVPLDFQRELSEEWHHVTGDSYIVDVRKVDTDTQSSFVKAVCEAFKYALKFSQLTVEQQVHGYKVLHGRRFIFAYGALYNLEISDSLLDDIDDWDKLEPYRDELYRYLSGGYVLRESVENPSGRPCIVVDVENDDASIRYDGDNRSLREILEAKKASKERAKRRAKQRKWIRQSEYLEYKGRILDQEYVNEWFSSRNTDVPF